MNSNTNTNTTGFRLYLDGNYDVTAWPFANDWRKTLAHLPADLPGAVTDFDIFLPDDCDNVTHVAIEREHASARTEMAVYRDGSHIVVVMRMTDPAPLPTMFAPGHDDGVSMWVAADPIPDDILYAGINPRGEGIAKLNIGVHPDRSGEFPKETILESGVEFAAHAFEGGWSAAMRFNPACVPGAGKTPARLRFSAGRILGDRGEDIGWMAAPHWFPILAQFGVLQLQPRATSSGHLHRADVMYNDADESGELVLSLEGVAEGERVPLILTINTDETTVQAEAVYHHPLAAEEGNNAITVKVGNQRSVSFNFEKWSGHRLFPRYGSSLPLPTLAELREGFEAAHKRRERGYAGHGVWTTSVAMEAEEAPVATGHEGLDHHCAFPMEPYAWACLVLDRQPVYEERVRDACERMLREERPGAYFSCLHHSVPWRPFLGGAFSQGSVGEALVLGYRLLGDERYLAASIRAAKAYDGYGLEENTNYMAFAPWHLAEIYEITGDTHELERAVWYTEHAILRGMNPSGAQPGHNYYTGYGDITLKGLSKLLRVLPKDHRFYEVLRERTIRYTNQMLSRQKANGLFEGLNRMYRGYQHTVCGFFEMVRALPEFAVELEPVLIHMINANPRAMGDAKKWMGTKEIALMARYVVEKAGSAD